MLFDVTFSDGSVRTLQAHNKTQLELALANVAFRKIIPSEQVSPETEQAFDALDKITQEVTAKQMKGLALVSTERRREIGSMGGKVAHRMGKAHEWTSEEAQEAGRKGGKVSRRRKKQP